MIQTNKLLPILTGIKKDKKLVNDSKPKLRLPAKKEAKLESGFKLNPFVQANSEGFSLGANPTIDFGNFSVGPYGMAAGSYADPRLVDYGIRGSYNINPNMSISGDVNPNQFRVGLNYKFQNGRQTGTPGTPNYREMAIAQGIAAADYDKNKAIIDQLLTEVILPGKYDPGFMARAKIAIARNKYPNIDNIIANIDKTTYQEGGPAIKKMINSEYGQWMFPNQITGIKGGSFNQAGDYSTSLTGEGILRNLLVLNPYGVKKLAPGTKQVSFPGDYQLEIPYARTGGSLPKAQYGYEQAKKQYMELAQKGPMFEKQMQDLVKKFPQLATDNYVLGARAISPTQQQQVQNAANRVVTNSLGRVISTPQSRADAERKEYVEKNPSQFREVPWVGQNGEVIQDSDPNRGIAIPDMTLQPWQDPINYIGLGKNLITGIGRGAMRGLGLGTRAVANTFNTPIIPNAAGLGARLGMNPTNYYRFAQTVNPITWGRGLTAMGLYDGAKRLPEYIDLTKETYNTGVDAWNNKPGAREEFQSNLKDWGKQTGYYGLLGYGAKDLAKVPGLMKGVYDAEQVAEKVPTLYNKFSNWMHSGLPHNNYFGSFDNVAGVTEDLVNLEQQEPRIGTLFNTVQEDVKFGKKWLEKKLKSESKNKFAESFDERKNRLEAEGKNDFVVRNQFNFDDINQRSYRPSFTIPFDSSQQETLFNVGAGSNPAMFKNLQLNNMKSKFQDGGSSQEQQVAQLIQMYAQMTGMQPQDIVEQLKSLPQEQQQQALQSIAQEVQSAMAQQQQGGAGQQMGMAKEGGEPCFDCFDHYNPSPQAQDLEWYYKKAKGGSTYMMDDLYQDGKQVHTPWRSYDPAIDNENPIEDLSMMNAIKRLYLGDSSPQNIARIGIFNPPGVWDALRLGYKALGAFNPDIANEMSRRDSIENAHALELNKRLGLPDFTHRKQVLEKKSGGNKYQAGRQTGNQTAVRDNTNAPVPNIKGIQQMDAVNQTLKNLYGPYTSITYPDLGTNFSDDSVHLYPGQGKVYFRDFANLIGHSEMSPLDIYRLSKDPSAVVRQDSSWVNANPEYMLNLPFEVRDSLIKQMKAIEGRKGGGEAFPQAQTYLPYDRPGETRPNFMFAEGGDTDDQWGGQPDINQIYDVMKRGGMAKDPKKKNGKDWDPNDFLSYMRSGGGLKKKVDTELPKHDMTGAVGTTPTSGKYKDPNAKSPWTYDYDGGKWYGYNKGKRYDISKYQSSVDILNKAYPDVIKPASTTTTDPFDAGNVYGTPESKPDEGFNTNPEGADALVPATADNTNKESKNKNKVQPMKSLINGRDIITAAATQSKNKAGFLPALSAAVNTVGFFGDMAKGYGNLGRLAGMPFKSNKGYTPMGEAPAGYTDYNPPVAENTATPPSQAFQNMQSKAANSLKDESFLQGFPSVYLPVPLTQPLMLPDDYPSPYEQMIDETNNPGSMYYNPSVKRKGGHIELPKKQMWKSQVSGSKFTPNASSYLMPQAGGLREDAIFDDWTSKNGMGTMDKFYSDNTAVDKDGNELYSYAPGSSADPNSPNFDSNTGKPEFNKDAGKKGFNLEYSSVGPERAIAGLTSINRFITGINENKEAKANKWSMKGSERINPVQGGMDQGDYLTNSPQGNDFRVNQHTYAQDPGRGYSNQQLQNAGKSIYSKHGGSIWDRYQEDQEIDLDDLTLEDLKELYANGGTIEFLG